MPIASTTSYAAIAVTITVAVPPPGSATGGGRGRRDANVDLHLNVLIPRRRSDHEREEPLAGCAQAYVHFVDVRMQERVVDGDRPQYGRSSQRPAYNVHCGVTYGLPFSGQGQRHEQIADGGQTWENVLLNE